MEALQPFVMDTHGQIVPQEFAPGTITQYNPAPQSNALMAGLRSGGDLFVKSLGGAAAAAGQALGSQGLQDFGVGVAQRYGDYAQQAARSDLENAPWYSPSGALYKGAQMLPSLGAMLGGALVGSAAGPAGAFAGGAAFAMPQSVGDFMNTAMEQPGGAAPDEGLRALALGAPLGALMAAAPPGLGASATKTIAQNALKDGLIMGGTMGVQQGISTAVDQTFRTDPGSFDDRAKEIVKSALSGFALGGITGGTIGAAHSALQKMTNADLAKVVDAKANQLAEPDAAAAGAEQAEGVAASAPPAPASEQSEAPAVRTIADHSTDELQQIHDYLSTKPERAPQEDQLLARIDAEFNTRNSTPEMLQQRLDEAKATNDPDQIKAAQDAFDSIQPEQQALDLGPEPTGEQPVSRAVREQQEAQAAKQQEFVDQAKQTNGKDTQFSKLLEREPVTSPEEFAQKVYENFDKFKQSTAMQDLAKKLDLLDEDGKLYTPETIEAAKRDAYTDLLNPTTESTAKVAKLDKVAQLIDSIDQKNTAETLVPGFEANAAPDAGALPEFKTTVDNTRAPGLPLDVSAPLPLQGFSTPLDMIRGLTNNERARTNTKAPTPEAEVVRMMNTKDLAPANAKVLEPLGLVADGKRLSYDDAISKWEDAAAEAQAKNDPMERGKAQANVDQLERIRSIDEFHKAQDQTAATLQKPTIKKAFQDLEQVRRQLPPEMVNAAERVQDMHTKLVAADTAGRTQVAGQARQLANVLKDRLAQAKEGHPADLTPLKAPQPAGAPSQAAIERTPTLKAQQQPKGRQRAAQAAPAPIAPPETARMAQPELRTRMDDDIEHLVSNGATARELVQHIAENSEDPFRRQLAQEMLKRGHDAEVQFASPEGVTFEAAAANDPEANVTGSLSADGKRINIYDRSTLEDTIMHEMVHVATQDALASGRGQASKQLEKLYQRILDKADTTIPGTKQTWYGMSNVKEFVAEAFTNPRFQEFLKTQAADTGSKLGDLWQQFKNVVFKALGMPERMRTAFEQALENGNRIMDEAPVSRDGVGSVPDAERQTHDMMNEMAFVRQDMDKLGEKANDVIKSGKSFNTKAVEFIKKKWNDISSSGTIARRILDEPLRAIAMRFDDVKRNRSAQFKQWSVLSDNVVKGWNELKGPVRVLISDLQQFDALHINPMRDWIGHPELHGTPELKAEVERANETYRKLKQMGGDKVYHDMIAVNDVMWRATQITKLEELVGPYIKDLGLTTFGEKLSNRYQMMDTLHTNVAKAQEFVKADYAAKMAELKTALGRKANEVSSLKSESMISDARQLQKTYAGLNEWVSRIEQSIKQSEDVPNFHKGRYGDYSVTAFFKASEDGKLDARSMAAVKARIDKATGGNTIFHTSGTNPKLFMRFENADHARDVHEILKAAQKEGLLDAGPNKDVRYDLVGDELSQSGNAPQHVKDMWERIANSDLYKSGDPAAQAALEEAKKQFMSAWLDLVPDNAVSNILQKRNYTQGSSGEVLRNFVTRNQILSHKISSGAASEALNGTIGEMRNRVKEMGAQNKPQEIEDATRDYRALVQYENALPKRVNDTFIDMMRSFNHAYFLGMSPSYVLMQMVQPWQTALPELGKHFGYAQSAKHLATVVPEVTKIMQAIIRAPTRIDGTITRQMLLDAGLDAKLVGIVMRGSNEGILELGGASRELGKVAAGTENQWHGKLTRMASALPMWSETASRLQAYIAADRLFEANPEKARIPGYKFDAKTATPAELEKAKAAYTRYFVQESMGRYGAGETPLALSNKGPLGAFTPLAGALMRYSMSMFEKVVHETNAALGRSTTDAYERAAARKYLAGHIGAMAVIAGSMGVPFFNAVTGLATKGLNFVTGQDNWDVASAYRGFLSDVFGSTVGDVIARGVPRAFGFDLEHLGEADLLPFTQILTDRRKWDDIANDLSKTLMGSPGSMVLSLAKGAEEMYQGRPLDGMIEAAPVALRNMLKAYKLNDRGYVDSTGRDIGIDSGPTDVIAQALGIKMAQPANYAEATHTMTQLNASRQIRSASLQKNLMAAFERGDSEDQASAMAAARKFDHEHPANRISDKVGRNLVERRKQEATAGALGTPIGLPVLDTGMRHQLRYNTNQ